MMVHLQSPVNVNGLRNAHIEVSTGLRNLLVSYYYQYGTRHEVKMCNLTDLYLLPVLQVNVRYDPDKKLVRQISL